MRNMYWKCLVLDFHKVMAALILVVFSFAGPDTIIT
jgi:hypothetical protein